MTVKLAILKKIQFSAEEIHEFELVDLPNGDVRGNQFKFRDIEVEVNEPEAAMLKKIPAKLEDKNEVTIDILPLLDKIDLL